jgi:hypothetical protein
VLDPPVAVGVAAPVGPSTPVAPVGTVFALGALRLELLEAALVAPPVEPLPGPGGALAPPTEVPPVEAVVVSVVAGGVLAVLPPPYTTPPSPCGAAGGFAGLCLWGLALLALLA